VQVPDQAAIERLLASPEPAIRFLTRRDVLGEPVEPEPTDVVAGPIVAALLAEAREGHPYRKWDGAHWRLVSLVELGIPQDEPRAQAALDKVLHWLASPQHRRSIHTVAGLTRRCASQEGNALAVAVRLGRAEDPRAELLARSLAEWQWPDGGWNCDVRASGRRSSFHESLPPMWGLYEYGRATVAQWALEAAARAAELFLEHQLFRSMRSGGVIKREWLALHFPPYWHYDVLQALLGRLGRLGRADDARAAEAAEHLRRRQLPDGQWRPGGCWWSMDGRAGQPPEVVDWGRSGPNEMITLNALRALRSAGR
jgi:hypothetical protein